MFVFEYRQAIQQIEQVQLASYRSLFFVKQGITTDTRVQLVQSFVPVKQSVGKLAMNHNRTL